MPYQEPHPILPRHGGVSPLITFTSAINRGACHTWPGLTVKRANTLLSPSPYTTMGHLHMVKQGIQSTRMHTCTRTKRHKIGVMTFDNTDPKHTVSINLPGRYSITLAQGHKNIFFMVANISMQSQSNLVKLRHWLMDSTSATTSYKTTNSR